MNVSRKQYIAAHAQIFKALGHPSRLLMVDALQRGEKCVCELQALIGDDMSTVSKHLAALKAAGIVVGERRGTNIYYRLRLTCLESFLRCTDTLLENRMALDVTMLHPQ